MIGLILALILCDWAYAYTTLSTKINEIQNEMYYKSAILLGGGKFHIFKYHIIPAAKPFLFELFLTGLSSTILTLSIISFLGLGIKDFYGITDWGSQVSFAKNYLLDYPMMTVLPSLGIFLTVTFFNNLRKKITF
jgi:ABC-type dipeptide/oligopeptide/nickel transport system permease subunit